MAAQPGEGRTSVKKTPAQRVSNCQRVNQIGIRCLISLLRRNQDAKPHRQQDTEHDVGELLEQLEPHEQRVGEHGGEVGEHGGEDRQHVHQQPSNSSSSEKSFEDAQKNW